MAQRRMPAPEPQPEYEWEWVDEVPPVNPPSGTVLTEERLALIEALKEKPGKWLKLPKATASLAYTARAGSAGFAPKGAFEARARKTSQDGRTADVYLRYIGDGS